MSTSNVRELVSLRQRERKLRQQMAWAGGEKRAALAQALEEVEQKIKETEARK